ncbi:hypothetical protein ACFLV0_06380 [Chloroflexota bacterium]
MADITRWLSRCIDTGEGNCSYAYATWVIDPMFRVESLIMRVYQRAEAEQQKKEYSDRWRATSFLGSSFRNEIKVQPSFADEAILEGSLYGALRLRPFQVINPLLRFIFSLPTLRVAKILVVTKWTANVIERSNKEFKRWTKPMEIVAGENACYTLLAFISIKMEIHWRSNPVGKVRYNLPSLRNLIEGNFTQSP